MKYYITKTEKRIIEILIAVLIILNMILCFKGMKLESDYAELMKEKEALEEIIEVQKNLLGGNE